MKNQHSPVPYNDFGPITELTIVRGPNVGTLQAFLSNFTDLWAAFAARTAPLDVYVIDTVVDGSYAEAYPMQLTLLNDHISPPLPAQIKVFRVPNSVLQLLADEGIGHGAPAIGVPPRQVANNLTPYGTIWASDAYFAVLIPGQPTTLVCPVRQPFRTQDNLYWLLAGNSLAMHNQCLVKPTPLVLAGSNLLLGQGMVMIGADVLHETARKFPEATHLQARIEAQMATEFFLRHTVWIGGLSVDTGPNLLLPDFGQGQYQALYHLDLFICPLGTHPIPYADPGGTVTRQQHVVLVGEAHWNPDVLRALSAQPGRELAEAVMQQIADNLDATADLLRHHAELDGKPIHVVRVPVVFAPGMTSDLAPFSYCNGLVDRDPDTGGLRYLVPSYALGAEAGLDHATALARLTAALMDIGLPVAPVVIPVASALYSQPSRYPLGALHCLVNVTRRLPATLPTAARTGPIGVI
jgi:hypothetical protein